MKIRMNRVIVYMFALALLLLGTAGAQDFFADWYPEPVRFVLEIQFDGEVVETLTYWIDHRALRAEGAGMVMVLVDEDGPVLYLQGGETGDVERIRESALDYVATILPIGSAAHPCTADWPCSRIGEDVIDDREVEIWQVEIPGLGETTAWVDKATRVQLRSHGTTEDGTVVTSEVVELEIGPQPLELFVPPSLE